MKIIAALMAIVMSICTAFPVVQAREINRALEEENAILVQVDGKLYAAKALWEVITYTHVRRVVHPEWKEIVRIPYSKGETNYRYLLEEGTSYHESSWGFGSGRKGIVTNGYVSSDTPVKINGWSIISKQDGSVKDSRYWGNKNHFGEIPEMVAPDDRLMLHVESEEYRLGWVDATKVLAREKEIVVVHPETVDIEITHVISQKRQVILIPVELLDGLDPFRVPEKPVVEILCEIHNSLVIDPKKEFNVGEYVISWDRDGNMLLRCKNHGFNGKMLVYNIDNSFKIFNVGETVNFGKTFDASNSKANSLKMKVEKPNPNANLSAKLSPNGYDDSS